jgi:hypothetical protein
MHELFLTLEMAASTSRLKGKRLTAVDLAGKERTIGEDLTFLLGGNTYKREHAWVLTHLNEAVRASRLSPQEQLKKFEELEKDVDQAPPLAQLLVRAYRKLAAANVRSVMLLDCARAGLGVERFRLQQGRWPDSLDEVAAAKLLEQVPVDPYDGKPLRYRRWAHGVVVYSIGPERTYAGDALDAEDASNPPAVHPEFRLWDTSQRRQPPRPRS